MRILSCLLVLLAATASAETVIAGATQPQLAQDADGGFYCTFLRGGNIEVSTSPDGGKTWSAPVVAIDARGNARGGMQRGPRIGVDAKKNIYVTAPICFDEAKLKEKYPKAELWLAVSSDAGKTFGKQIRVNEVEDSAAEALHQLAVAPDGTAHIVWLDAREGKGQNLYHAKFAAGKLGKNVRISAPVCPCCAPGLALDGKGNPTVVYREMADDADREIMLIASRDGGKAWSAPGRVNRTDTNLRECPMDAPAVAVADDGKKFLVSWMGTPEKKNRDVFWAVSGAGGKLPPETLLSDKTNGVQGHVSAGIDAAGVFHIAWEDAASGQTQIYGRSSAAGAKNERLSAEGVEAKYPSVSAGKSVGVVWEQGGGVEFRAIK